jgi:hypothetical protein
MRLVAIPMAVVTVASAQADPGTPWATVPASRGALAIETLVVPRELDEGAVRLVGAPHGPSPVPLPLRVMAVDVGILSASPGPKAPAAPGPPAPMARAMLWPDPDGRITEPAADPGGGVQAVRNPWEVRIRQKDAGHEAVFLCGGFIAGGPGGAVAFVNGRVVKRGDTVSGFEVARVEAGVVVLARDSSSFALPMGRRVAILMRDP